MEDVKVKGFGPWKYELYDNGIWYNCWGMKFVTILHDHFPFIWFWLLGLN